MRLFREANATYAAGLAYRTPGEETCQFGHTDHMHAVNTSVAGLCRERYVGDTCSQPVPAPYVCACVSNDVAFVAQDPIGRDQRFNLLMVGMGFSFTAAIMIIARIISLAQDWCRRRYARGQLRYSRAKAEQQADSQSGKSDLVKSSTVKKNAMDAKAVAQIKHELLGLFQCMCAATCIIASVGGPLLIYVSTPQEHGYFAGCGFLIPKVIVTRPDEIGG